MKRRGRVRVMASKEGKALIPFEALGFAYVSQIGDEVYGDCLFCGGRRKLYVNVDSGQWHCKAGRCETEGGNLINFLETWVEQKRAWNDANPPDWDSISEDRGFPVDILQNTGGVVFDGLKWVIPIRNRNGRICTLRLWKPGDINRALKGPETQLWGIHELYDPKKKAWPVWLVEGEWDRLAMILLLRKAKKLKVIVVSVPGAGVFKEEWAEALAERDVMVCYDADTDGRKGVRRAYARLVESGLVNSFKYVAWPETTPDGFDVRDFWNQFANLKTLEELLADYEPEDSADIVEAQAKKAVEDFPLLSSGERPSFESCLDIFREHLEMTQDAEDALRVIAAVIMAQQIDGDSLWVHICSPPGGTKTELLMACSEARSVVTRSTVTVHSLVSGFNLKGDRDPSLIPKLNGSTFILKDYTEILDMPAAIRHEIFAIFRGAYDKRVEKTFGNGVARLYRDVSFNMLTGVTPAIFRESGASLGERFLIYHMNQGVGEDWSEMVWSAFLAVGTETGFREELAATMKRFLEFRITPADVPKVTREQASRLVNLAQLVAMLRANVEKDFTRERLLYKPQHEVGTRLAKQLHKLVLALGMLNYPAEIGERELQIASRVALNSCMGWNLDALKALVSLEGRTVGEVAASSGIPVSTLRERLEDLFMLGVLRKETNKHGEGVGRGAARYFVTDIVKQFWEGAGIRIESKNGKVDRLNTLVYKPVLPSNRVNSVQRNGKTPEPLVPMIRRKKRRVV
jgi:hypothetical protein